MDLEQPVIRISVRNLVEFILRAGDIDNRIASTDKDTMQLGSRIHRKIQKQMGPDYHAEISLKYEIPCKDFTLKLEGRADGIIELPEGIVIDEIKGVLRDLNQIKEPVPVHLAQAMCYAYIYAASHNLPEIGVQMTYCNMETEEIKRFQSGYIFEDLEWWFYELIGKYEKWARYQIQWKKKRDKSIKDVEFPFAYREGQKNLVTSVYRTILRKKKLFIQAPTGVGKTIATLFPAVKAVGEGLGDKIFYLTAKTITRTVAWQAFETLRQKGLITDDMFDILSESIKTLGNDTTNMAGQINLGSQSAQKSYDDLKLAIGNLTNQMHLGTDEQGQLLNALDRTVDSGGTAQDAYNNVMAAVKNMGGNTETAAKIFSEVFPNAVQVTKSSVDKNIIGAQQTVTTSTGKMKADAETNLAGLQKAAENASGGVNTATVKNWGNSASEVDKNLDQMKQHANLKLGEMQKTVDSHFSSQYNTMTTKWQKANERISQIIADMAFMINNRMENLVSSMERAGSRMGNGLSRGVSEGTSGVKRALNNAVSKVNSTIGNINSALSGIEHGFTFSYDVQLPTGGRRWGNYSLNLPRVNTVPYLATGAVIPPRSEFLAVLGDQKNGRNLEAPESLIRQIFREETGSNQGNNTYNVSVSASGRKLLDIVLEEGALRRNRNGGKNPFKLDD